MAASERREFRLPDVGEGLVEAEISSWRVAVGDTVAENTVLVEIETAKSLVELPSPFAGVVSELLVAEGQTVPVGTPIIAVDLRPAAGPAAGRPAEPAERTAVLVGYGPRTTDARRRPRLAAPGAAGGDGPVGTAVATAAVQAAFATDRTVAQPVAPPRPRAAVVSVPDEPVPGAFLPDVGTVDPATPPLSAPPPPTARVLAKPPVRRLARDLGVDLARCSASGPAGSVTRDDVLAAAALLAAPGPGADMAGQHAGAAAPGAREDRVPVRGVRRATAEAMVRSAFTAPHVTEFLAVDVTRTVRLVRRLRSDPHFAGVRVTPLLLVARALLVAVRRNPGANAAWDEAAQEIAVRHYVNLGVAVATPRGLLVPNIKEAQAMSLRELADALAATTATARAGRTPPADLRGGTISVTNVGAFGVDTGTPILNPGEAAILCVGAIRRRPWVHKGRVVPRRVVQLSLSFDHRVVDGDLGSRLLADVGAVLNDPVRALVWT